MNLRFPLATYSSVGNQERSGNIRNVSQLSQQAVPGPKQLRPMPARTWADSTPPRRTSTLVYNGRTNYCKEQLQTKKTTFCTTNKYVHILYIHIYTVIPKPCHIQVFKYHHVSIDSRSSGVQVLAKRIFRGAWKRCCSHRVITGL